MVDFTFKLKFLILLIIALQEIKYEDNYNLFVDFFGRKSSPFLQTVFEIILNEMKDLSALPSFTQLNQKNVTTFILHYFLYFSL